MNDHNQQSSSSSQRPNGNGNLSVGVNTQSRKRSAPPQTDGKDEPRQQIRRVVASGSSLPHQAQSLPFQEIVKLYRRKNHDLLQAKNAIAKTAEAAKLTYEKTIVTAKQTYEKTIATAKQTYEKTLEATNQAYETEEKAFFLVQNVLLNTCLTSKEMGPSDAGTVINLINGDVEYKQLIQMQEASSSSNQSNVAVATTVQTGTSIQALLNQMTLAQQQTHQALLATFCPNNPNVGNALNQALEQQQALQAVLANFKLNNLQEGNASSTHTSSSSGNQINATVPVSLSSTSAAHSTQFPSHLLQSIPPGLLNASTLIFNTLGETSQNNVNNGGTTSSRQATQLRSTN